MLKSGNVTSYFPQIKPCSDPKMQRFTKDAVNIYQIYNTAFRRKEILKDNLRKFLIVGMTLENVSIGEEKGDEYCHNEDRCSYFRCT